MIRLLLFCLIFIAGFLTHALFFSDILTNGITDIKRIVQPHPISTQATNNENSLTTTISFDGEKFSRNNITISFSRYLHITNTSSEKLMWITSDNPQLATNRGYGNSETVKARMDKKGQFVVIDKNNPQEKIIITVK